MATRDTCLLAIETATSVCSTALFKGRTQLSLRTEITRRRHNEKLAGMVEKVIAEGGLKNRDIEVIAVSIGPGSFTGLRVGLSFAKGFAMGIDAAVVPVMTLDGLAHRMYTELEKRHGAPFTRFRLCPLTIARRSEVFGRLYRIDGNGVRPAGDTFLGDAEFLLKIASGQTIIGGEGADALADALNEKPGELTAFPERGELPPDYRSGIVHIPGIQASGAQVGQIGMKTWETDRRTLQPADRLEPLYLKEFTVRGNVPVQS